jgi:hypothetical protein
MSSNAGNKGSSGAVESLKLQGTSKNVNRTQTGRKTTSTFLRDLDDLVSQEAAPSLPKTNRRAPASGRGLPARGEQKGGTGRADKRPVRRNIEQK